MRRKAKFHRGQKVVGRCGCVSTVEKVGRRYYTFKSVNSLASIQKREPYPDEIYIVDQPIDKITHAEYTLLDPTKPCPYCKEIHS